MTTRILGLIAGTTALIVSAYTVPAQALTMHECSLKYKQAQSAGALKGMNWNAFRKAECGPNASPAAASGATTTAAPGVARVGNAVFPTAVSPRYASEKAGRARMHTCRDQYRLNKASNTNGGLKWIQKGGGYYSECNKRLGGG